MHSFFRWDAPESASESVWISKSTERVPPASRWFVPTSREDSLFAAISLITRSYLLFSSTLLTLRRFCGKCLGSWLLAVRSS